MVVVKDATQKRSRPRWRLRQSGWIWPSKCFRYTVSDASGTVVVCKRLRRGAVLSFFARLPQCLVGMEACAGAHYWAREIGALGHEVRLMPARYVKAYVQRGKSDAGDAAAICEAVGRPRMRFVAIKTAEQQAVLLLHRSRDLLVRQRTMLVKRDPGAFGRVRHRRRRWAERAEPAAWRASMTAAARRCRPPPGRRCNAWSSSCGRRRRRSVRSSATSTPGTGRMPTASDWPPFPVLARSSPAPLAASVPDAGVFRSGRDLAAWIGLVPRQNSSGGKERLGPISKQGDR